MRTLVSGFLTVEAYDRDVYKQERNVLRVNVASAAVQKVYLYINAPAGAPIATYTLDAAGNVTIDMSDYIRTYGTADVTDVFVAASQYRVKPDFAVVGLIAPESVLIPDAQDMAELKAETGSGTIIVPPFMMLEAIKNGLLSWENYGTIGEGEWAGRTKLYYESATATTATGRTMTAWVGQSLFAFDVIVVKGSQSFVTKRTIKPLECGKRYAAVRWVSFTGQTRVATFEVRGAKTETAEAVDLLTVDGSYNIIKGRTDGFVLFLDGLCSYDVWYYGDVCHSSRVEVSFDGETWQRVGVETKEVETPDGNGGAFNKLEIAVNYKQYDAVSM